MKICFFIILLNISFHQSFTLDQFFGEIIRNDIEYDQPFLGGFNKPKIQWIDWDHDGYQDLFILDEDGHIQYFKSVDGISYNIIDMAFMDISNISWFFIGNFDNDDNYEIVTQNPYSINNMLYYDFDTNTITPILDINQTPIESEPVMTPAFIDIDNDGLLDFFTGNMIGTVNFYKNVGIDNNSPQFEFITNFWEDIYIVGSSLRHGASAINFIDIDNDQDYDLAWGDYYQQSLYIITNNGSPEIPDMDNINITQQYPMNNPIISAGLNMPVFGDIDNDEDSDLFITVLSGAYGYQLINNFYHYENVDGEYQFRTDEFIETLDLYSDTYPEFIDIDNDNDLDLFIGTDIDLSITPWNGKVKYFENIGIDNEGPIWSIVDEAFLGGNIGHSLSIDFGDIDNDNDFDLIVGDFNGILRLFLNEGNQYTPQFSTFIEIPDIDLSGYSVPKWVDIDNDNDLDLFIGHLNGSIYYYNNNGTATNHNYVLVTENFEDIIVENRSTIEFYDLDIDGDYDLFVGSKYEGLFYYENIGDSENFEFILNNEIDFQTLGLNLSPAIWKESNFQPRLLLGNSKGGLYCLKYYGSNECAASGDFNNDQIINIIDIIFIINVILNIYNIEDECMLDINNDFSVDVIDVVLLVEIILDN